VPSGRPEYARIESSPENAADRKLPQPRAKPGSIAIFAGRRKDLLCGHKDRLVQGMEQWTNVPGNKDVRIDPDDFVEPSIEQLHNSFRLYVPAVTILQPISLQLYLRVRT
jgi:hypothetical protein